MNEHANFQTALSKRALRAVIAQIQPILRFSASIVTHLPLPEPWKTDDMKSPGNDGITCLQSQNGFKKIGPLGLSRW